MEYKDRIQNTCLALFILVIPFELIFTPIALTILIISHLIFGSKNERNTSFLMPLPVWLIIILFLLHPAGMLINEELEFSYKRIDTQLLMFFVPLALLLVNLKPKQITIIKKTIILSSVIFCLLAITLLIYNLIVNFEHKGDYNFVQTSMYHFHYPYDVLYINIAYILLLFNKFFNKFKLAISTLFFIIIVLSGVRIGLAMFFLLTVTYTFFNFKRLVNIRSLLILLGLIILGLIMIKNSKYASDKFFDSLEKIGFDTGKYVSEIGEKYHKISLREKLWSSAKQAFSENRNKIIGYGPQGSREVLDRTYKEKNLNQLIGLNSHNQYLTTLLNNGIIGLLILISIISIGFISSLNKKSAQNFLLVFVIAIAFITESMLERQKGVTIFTVILTTVCISNNLNSRIIDGSV